MSILHALASLFSGVAYTLFALFLAVGAFFMTTLPQIAHHTAPKAPTAIKTTPDAPNLISQTKTRIAASNTQSGSLKNASVTSATASVPTAVPPPNVSTLATTSAANPITPTQTKNPDQINLETRAALVNILCTTRSGGSFEPLSGSGIIITQNGVILTNAHVAQFTLLRDYPRPGSVDCVVRMGSPARALYRASLLYLPPAWVDANASKIDTEAATSTGEGDYAFLLITSTVSGEPLPASFPSIPLTTDAPTTKETAYVAAYPAQYLGGATIQQSLYASSAYPTVEKLFGFNETEPTADLFSLTGSVVSQSGSSGGAVVRPQDGALEGIITTESEGTTTADRSLFALTLGHIDRSLSANNKGGIITLLSGDLVAKVIDFNSTIAPSETQKLVEALK